MQKVVEEKEEIVKRLEGELNEVGNEKAREEQRVGVLQERVGVLGEEKKQLEKRVKGLEKEIK